MPEESWYRRPGRIIAVGVAGALLIALTGSLAITKVRSSQEAASQAWVT